MEDNSSAIELIEFSKPFPQKKIRNELIDCGITHIALTVDNLDEIYIQLKKLDIKFNHEPQLSPNGKLKVAFCQDPEGNYLELIEEI